MFLKTQVVDCGEQLEQELKKVLRDLLPSLKKLIVDEKTIDDVQKIVLYKNSNRLKEFVEEDFELKKIQKEIEKLLKSASKKNPSFGTLGYVFLCVDDSDFLDESVIAEEIIHSLIEIKINNGILDEKVFENYEISPKTIARNSKLWESAKDTVTHYHLFKILIDLRNEKIRKKTEKANV